MCVYIYIYICVFILVYKGIYIYIYITFNMPFNCLHVHTRQTYSQSYGFSNSHVWV